jgi:pimeloyl-ACP methyl ester carboxylesterase/DNA-binding CsgD family transcriptional regulator
VTEKSAIPELKKREREILALLSQGKTARAIGTRLNLAPETVRWYNKQIYRKLGVSSREEAVRSGIALGFIGASLADHSRPPVERSPIRYVTSENVSIAYQVIGRGPVDLLFMTGFVSHLELSWDDPGYTEFFESLGRYARVILFDKRGVGLSDRVQGASSIEDTISDARAVLQAAGSRRAFVSGTSESGAAAVLMASMHPELVRGLILIAATPMPARHGAEPEWSRPWESFEQIIALIKSTWGEPWAIERLAPSRLGDPVFEAWWARTLRAASSPSSVELIMKQTMQVDIRAILPHVRQRTLVIHKRGDRSVNVGAGRFLAERMPNASLVELPGDDHVYFVNGPPIVHAMTRFISEPDVEPEVDTWVAIVLHVAGAGSTIDEEKRRILDALQPRAIRTTALGWVAMFDAPNRAIRCAQRLQALGRGRVGGMALHVGACRSSDGAPVGGAHEIAGRLVESAEPGEILVSGTFRDILAGSAARLTPRSLDGGDAFTSPATVWRLEGGE